MSMESLDGYKILLTGVNKIEFFNRKNRSLGKEEDNY